IMLGQLVLILMGLRGREDDPSVALLSSGTVSKKVITVPHTDFLLIVVDAFPRRNFARSS
ncbi:hypothetical protein, partial [Listeria welshimeri]|uniref:hypothetical protein n=1 Tax=Listeria welshimeri TaxID=1643 RepID=UPI001E4D4D6E